MIFVMNLTYLKCIINLNRIINISLFVLSFFLYSCTKTKSDYIQDLDGKLYMK